ncbi:MAG: SEC-C metal-binding domain-containing protein [Elusimicrobiota bacterium]|jgi:hypothetical protein
MVWNPIQKLKDKLTGKAEETAPASNVVSPAMAKAAAAAAGGLPDMKELEKKGLMRQFFRHWKDPAFLKQLQSLAALMKKDGVDVKDQAAVKVWIEKHQKELASGELTKEAEVAKPKTVVNTGPDVGRNDPCTCGSGKKYKKCCGISK